MLKTEKSLQEEHSILISNNPYKNNRSSHEATRNFPPGLVKGGSIFLQALQPRALNQTTIIHQQTMASSESDIRTKIPYELNWAYNFVDPDLQEKFQKFFFRRKYTKVIHYCNFYSACILIPTNILAMAANPSPNGWLFSSLLTLLNLLWVMSGICVCWEKHIPAKYDNWLHVIRRVNMFAAAAYSLFIASRKFIVECDQLPEGNRDIYVGWHCADDPTIMPTYTVALLCLIPICTMICLNETRLDLVFFSILLTNGIFIVLVLKFVPKSAFIKDLLVVTVIAFLVCIDIHQSHIEFFIACDKLEATLAENKRMQEENRAAELRSMIGNLTHDLKTPLSSFMSGIDIMAHNISEIVSTMKETELSMFVSMQSQFDSLLQCFKNIRNTNTFMVMTINRCLDYTKASRGLKLAPKYETVDLMETLSMPLQCMKNIQDRIGIEMEEIGAEICSHVITDKQWLQENILCLLSNAVKYSSEGIVTISVSLKVHDVEEGNDRGGNVPALIPSGSMMLSSKKNSFFGFYFDRRSRKALYSIDESSSKQSIVVGISFLTTSSSRKTYPEKFNISLKHAPSVDVTLGQQSAQRFTQKQYLRFEISDHGIGLTEEGMKNLFNPFQQAQKLAGGTGMILNHFI
jgi:signal transduction histidine kinase